MDRPSSIRSTGQFPRDSAVDVDYIRTCRLAGINRLVPDMDLLCSAHDKCLFPRDGTVLAPRPSYTGTRPSPLRWLPGAFPWHRVPL